MSKFRFENSPKTQWIMICDSQITDFIDVKFTFALRPTDGEVVKEAGC